LRRVLRAKDLDELLGFAPAFAARPAPEIDALKLDIQGKEPDEVRALIVRRLGQPVREVGSGFRIEQWDVDGGVLTFHELVGPWFDRDGVRTRLIRTNNPAAIALLGDYEVSAMPDEPGGTGYGLGDLSLSTGSRYTFTLGDKSLESASGQRGNFFILHPNGFTEIKYAGPVTADTRLEDLSDGTVVAIVTFVARDRQSRQVYRALSYRTSMNLQLEGENLPPFRVAKSWVNFWR
jgi:hypothetical protein